MEKISKNIYKGEQILDIREIIRLANERKSIIQKANYANRMYIVRPAAFYLNWPLRLLLICKFYYAIKIKE